MRIATLSLALLLGILGLAACNGDDEKEAPTTTPATTDTATATPSPAAASIEPSCEFPPDVTSYRFTMTMKMTLPGLEETPEADDPLGEFLGTLISLFQDLRLEGAFVAPDRASVEVFTGEEIFVESRQIGDASWSRAAGMDWTRDEDGEEEAFTFLSPQDFCEAGAEDIASELSALEPQKETINGVDTLHYSLDTADLEFLSLLFEEEEEGELPETFAMDLWLAEDGNWPVRMSFEASDQDEEGNPVEIEIFMELRDINDPDIEIEAPI
jgi:hypothetical protein